MQTRQVYVRQIAKIMYEPIFLFLFLLDIKAQDTLVYAAKYFVKSILTTTFVAQNTPFKKYQKNNLYQ